jgi:hypothetical protein
MVRLYHRVLKAMIRNLYNSMLLIDDDFRSKLSQALTSVRIIDDDTLCVLLASTYTITKHMFMGCYVVHKRHPQESENVFF